MLQFLSLNRFVSEPVITSLPVDTTQVAAVGADTPESIRSECGWFDSSFELRFGLLVQELPGFGAGWQMASPAPMQ